jgi:kanosamine 6-kinase
MIVDTAGDQCECGRRGCLQATASGRAVLRRAKRLRGGSVDFARLRQGWADGETWADAAVRAGCAALAACAVGIAEMVRNEVTIIGGGLAELPGFVAVVAEHVERLRRDGHDLPEVRRSALAGASSLQGALLLAREARAAAPAPQRRG